MQEINKAYNPKEVEEKWLRIWLENKLFKSTPDSNKESFSITLPPPNVTGNLHMGHAFGNTIQDVLIRYNKMSGKNVLWQGGTDHAGIGTQVVVEKDLSKKEKKRKEDIGREEFLKRIWQWKEKNGNEIIEQIKKLGCYMDYDRLVFTMDENYTKAIRKVFVELYNKKLIYRGKRIVNWCPKCTTSLSDLEVESEEIKGKLYHILYPFDLKDISKGGITVATTRPETLFGDISVCINPNDGRYKKLVGKHVYLPLINKTIPIISDEIIKMDFGTGAVKTTPAHDANDHEIFNNNKDQIEKYGTHFFPYPVIMDAKGKIQDLNNIGIPDEIKGIERFKAREITVQKLEEFGFLKKIEEYDQTQDKHDRCGTIIEPYLSDQWYVKMEPLAKKAIEVVEKDKKIKFIPERYTDHYLNWLKNIKDWCISRQLWWGHQIPVWYKKSVDRKKAGDRSQELGDSHQSFEDIYVGEDPPKDIENYVQDPDVLDTWFSSALWPFATLGWPQNTDYLKTFYPTSVLATAREIINLWVSRMVFMGLEFVKDIPFKEVLIHPVIQTPDGKRMSKSKGNAIDPLEMIDKYGADANRFWYFSVGITGNQDVRFPGRKGKDGKWESDTLEQYKRFANKLWNASRFVLQNLEENKKYNSDLSELNLGHLTIPDRWILHNYNELVIRISNDFSHTRYNFSEISKWLYRFIWDEFCDWYIEIAKQQLSNADLKENTQKILYSVIHGIIRLLHPVMPFITEELWNALPKVELDNRFIVEASLPIGDSKFIDDSLYSRFSYIIDTTREIRNQRQMLGIPWVKEMDVRLYTQNKFEKEALVKLSSYIESLTKSQVTLLNDFEPIKPSTGALVRDTRILIPLTGLVDLDNMLNALNKKKLQYQKDKESQESKLRNTNFISNAPQDKIEEVKARVNELENQIKTIEEQIELLK
ncbi:MAG: valine--tRNA ligase [Candidatus Melainabacteria bacterium]|nr:valine--tRNA ligase [Candidatus Melainabacteria bacterium]